MCSCLWRKLREICLIGRPAKDLQGARGQDSSGPPNLQPEDQRETDNGIPREDQNSDEPLSMSDANDAPVSSFDLLGNPDDADLLHVVDVSAGISKRSPVSGVRTKGDVYAYGAVDSSTIRAGITAAIADGITDLYFSRDYTIDGTDDVFDVPSTGIRLISKNQSRLTFTADVTLMDVPLTTGNIEILGLEIATDGVNRVTIAEFEPLTTMGNLVIKNCWFEGKTRLLWDNDGSTDPGVTLWGMDECYIHNNFFKNHNSRFINFNNVPHDYSTFDRNEAHNMGSTLSYWGRGGTYSSEIGALMKINKVMRNEVYCDPDYWANDPEGSYLPLSLFQGYEHEVGFNTIVGLKATLDGGENFQPFNMTAMHVWCHDNEMINCGNNGAGTTQERIIFNTKGHPAIFGEVPTALIENNTIYVDPDYFPRNGTDAQSQTQPVWYLMKTAQRHAHFRNNYIDIPILRTQGDVNSEAVFESFRWNGNTLRVRDEMLAPSVLRIEPGSDTVDIDHPYEINDNVFDIETNSDEDCSLIRFTSDFTRGDGDDVVPQVVKFNGNRARLRGRWEHLLESGGSHITFDGHNNVIEIDDVVRAIDNRCLLRNFQAKIIHTDSDGGSLWPTSDAIFYDQECSIDLEIVGSLHSNNFNLPLNTEVLAATTARVVIDCEVTQEDGDYTRGVCSFLLDDSSGLRITATGLNSGSPCPIPNGTTGNDDDITCDNMVSHGSDLLAAVNFHNDVTPSFLAFPNGKHIRMRVKKMDI